MKKGVILPAAAALFLSLILTGCPPKEPTDTTMGGEDAGKEASVDTTDGTGLDEVAVDDDAPVVESDSYTTDIGGSGRDTGRDTYNGGEVDADGVEVSVYEDTNGSKILDAFFDYNRHNIRGDARDILMTNAEILKNNPDLYLKIEGHCDERGTIVYNVALGERRANSAKRFLVDLGVSEDRIETVSYGKEKPFCFDHNETCWQDNRRVHFIIR